MGIRNIARYLKISVTTVQNKIIEIAKGINKPCSFQQNQNYQIDEMKTFIKTKEEGGIWIFYALEKKTRKVI